jgi:hypothetical protein
MHSAAELRGRLARAVNCSPVARIPHFYGKRFPYRDIHPEIPQEKADGTHIAPAVALPWAIGVAWTSRFHEERPASPWSFREACMRQFVILGLFATSGIVCAAGARCDDPEQIQELLAAGAKPSAAVLRVVQSTAAPGTSVKVLAESAVFGDGSVRILIGGQTALIKSIISDEEAEAVVPVLKAGMHDVQIAEPNKLPGAAAQLNVTDPPAKLLVLSMSDQGIELQDSFPMGGAPYRNGDDGGQRIHYEVLNPQGRILFHNVINHPTEGRLEVYDRDDKGEPVHYMAPKRLSAVFSLSIPNVPGGALLKLYDVPADADLGTPAGLAARTFLADIQIPG